MIRLSPDSIYEISESSSPNQTVCFNSRDLAAISEPAETLAASRISITLSAVAAFESVFQQFRQVCPMEEAILLAEGSAESGAYTETM